MIPHRPVGLLLLGTEAYGDLAMPLAPGAALPAPTRLRATQHARSSLFRSSVVGRTVLATRDRAHELQK